MFFTIAVIVLVFLVIFQIAKASEYVSVLKGEEKSRAQQNKINGFFMIAFLVLGLVGVYWCNELLFKKTLLAHESASVQGEKVDSMLWVTLVVTGVVFFITQIALFWFSYKYQENPKRKAFYFPHNNTMEIVWTVVPAIALTVLVVIGLRNWFMFTSDAPSNALTVEVTGKQFGWIFRYPGKDGVLGKKYFRVIDAASNSLGLIWKDSAELKLKDDPATHDDIVTEQTVYVVKGRPVKFIIGSRDVIHDVGLPQFRMKMDAVPGTPTTMWFTPKFTTKEMKERTGNPDFQYEISCDQMCGNGHYSMKGVVEVVTQAEFDEWMAKQKPAYVNAFPQPEAPAPAAPAAAPADSTKKAAAKATVSDAAADAQKKNKS
jgi:cytochrome c oxidase subunit 2